MAESKINRQINEIIPVLQDARIPENSQTTPITANVPSGYKFLCWVSVSSNSWVGGVYLAVPKNITTDIWAYNSSTSSRLVTGMFLAYK